MVTLKKIVKEISYIIQTLFISNLKLFREESQSTSLPKYEFSNLIDKGYYQTLSKEELNERTNNRSTKE